MSFAIETSQLHYRAGAAFAIEGLDLHVPAGAVYGFLGPNGSGKTTTIRLLLGLLRPRSGQITVLGAAMPGQAPAVLARVGYVPEQPHFDPTLTLRDLLRFQAAFYPRWSGATADDLLQRFELAERQPFGRLSKGQKGKFMMLVALAQQPELLLLDEPTDGLDPVARRDILASLLDYVSERQATVLISSHLVHELERICDWVGVMDGGHLVAELPMERFKRGTKRLLVGAGPAPDLAAASFRLLSREPAGEAGETWIVRDWEPEMRGFFRDTGVPLRDVVDLDLEDGFVELLRSFRARERR